MAYPAEMIAEPINRADIWEPIAGDARDKNLLTMRQLEGADIHDYLHEAYAAELAIRSPQRGVDLLPFRVAKAIMRQDSTRTGGSFTTAMDKLGGQSQLISGMKASSEGKGETRPDSYVALATQADILGIRAEEDDDPAVAAQAISDAVATGGLWHPVPVINLGDGRHEHPTQALGDLYTIHKHFKSFDGLALTIVGDQERYRAHHSLMIGAAILGLTVIAVESPVAPVPPDLVDLLGTKLTRTDDLDSAMRDCDVLYLGRNPAEYTGQDRDELARSRQLEHDYLPWTVDCDRIQQLKKTSIVLHPRPRLGELDPNVDRDPRMKDVNQMQNQIPMRMAIIARHLGASIARQVRG
ncbi:MAG: hypothetical protein ABI602_04575 [Candidatus Saccharibacteria bacterium]